METLKQRNTYRKLETQTRLYKRAVSRRRVGGLLLGCVVVFSAWPVFGQGSEQSDAVPTRKAQRAYVVVRESNASEPVSHRSGPADPQVLSGVPRARVVGQVLIQPAPEDVLIPEPELEREPKPIQRRTTVQSAPSSPSALSLVQRCDVMALQGLKYTFGSDDPSRGGLDCSGAVQYLLKQEGIQGVPRTAFTQYEWLRKSGALKKVSRWSWSAERVAKELRPGDLMFWTGTYETGNHPNISHVMIYLGRDASSGKHYMFGASSRRSKGVHGHAVDVYEFVYPRAHGKDNFAGFGSVPGLR